MQTVRVRLRKPRRVLTFTCGDHLLVDRDDACIVQSDRGIEWGTCVLPPEPCPPGMEERHTMRLLRKAHTNDHKTYEMLCADERRARGICLQKIEQSGLPMKLVDVEYTFDKRKIVFCFTAEERVDFRELVRDLAHELRARIELRHIQVRDEAKMVGGLGSCGRQLCCAAWIEDFKPISMRMAKRQNLSLNPSKISGQCGRLLCCLGYENEQYEPLKKKSKQPDTPPCAPVQEEADAGGEEAVSRPDTATEAERSEAGSKGTAGQEETPASPETQHGEGAADSQKQSSRQPRRRGSRRRKNQRPRSGDNARGTERRGTD